MKTTCIFVLVAVGIFCSSGNAEPGDDDNEGTEPACDQYPLPGCPRNIDPVCGTDGVTYANECKLCEANQKVNIHIKIKKRGIC